MKRYLMGTAAAWALAVMVSSAWGGVPDPAHSIVMPWDNYGHALMNPGTGGDSLLVVVRDATGAFCRFFPVEIDVSDCSNLCVDCPNGLRGTTNFAGFVILDPRTGSCETCDVVVKAGDVVLRTFTRVVSADWDGVQSDARVGMSDLAYFTAHYPSPPQPYDACLDYNADSLINDADYAVIYASFGGANIYLCEGIAGYEATPPCLDFGNVAVGSWRDRTFTITNTTGGTVTDTVRAACGDFTIESGDGAYTLANGESHEVTVRFQPADAGSLTCVIQTGDDWYEEQFCVGFADYPPACVVAPSTVDFDTVLIGSWSEKTFTIRNTGGGVLSDSVMESSAHYAITSGGGPFAIGGGDSLVVRVRFEPTAMGPLPCTIDAGDPLCSAVSCTGVGRDPASGVRESAVPVAFALHQNVPNPFNPVTKIRFDVPASGGWVTVRVYDARGRLVRTLVDGSQAPGHQQVRWDARNEGGHRVASGVYFCRMTAAGFAQTRKMVVLE